MVAPPRWFLFSFQDGAHAVGAEGLHAFSVAPCHEAFADAAGGRLAVVVFQRDGAGCSL